MATYNNQQPKDKDFCDYLFDALSTSKALGEHLTRETFLLALKDFFNDVLSFEGLGTVATQLYYVVNKPFTIDTYFERTLANILFETAEVDCHLEGKDDNPSKKQDYEYTLGKLRAYFEANKASPAKPSEQDQQRRSQSRSPSASYRNQSRTHPHTQQNNASSCLCR